ncbi:hypothetical protein [Pseudolysinimonas sp.]|uniref:hypothetical protein n=1 Tax=Pseudolysinimonas sp. TaxID=2680009 RepID=UPI003F7D08F4
MTTTPLTSGPTNLGAAEFTERSMMLTVTAPTPVATPAPATTTATPPAALTAEQEDNLLTIAASVEKPNRVPTGQRQAEPRAWSRGGNVD